MEPTWQPYGGDRYLSFDEISTWIEQIADTFPDWVSVTSIGTSRHGLPLHLVTLGRQDGNTDERTGFWLDGGTHAAEWTSVMSCIYSMSAWLGQIEAQDTEFCDWLCNHTIYIMPCVSPDGFDALVNGKPFLRSCLRPPAIGRIRSGLDPQDLTGNGEVRWMRWRHPAGPYVPDEALPGFMRPRTLDDPAENAYFFAPEGLFVNWDGAEWKQAPREFGLDLNRNFPSHWAPFSMFGMDGGAYSLSEPESRALIDAFTDKPYIAAGLTNHTYTGAILTQPSRENSVLSRPDILLLERIAKEVVDGTDYRVFRIFPEFAYDKKKAVVGLWSDTMTETLGVPAFTLELWDPFKFCGLENKDPAGFFVKPDHEVISQLVRGMVAQTDALDPWVPFEHPQLGSIEVGGLNYMKTVRNPPDDVLPKECERGHIVADRLRKTVPQIHIHTEVERRGESSVIRFVAENLGYLSTMGLDHAANLPTTPCASVHLELGNGVHSVIGQSAQTMEHLGGWGLQSTSGANAIYPSLSGRSHRQSVEFEVQGQGTVILHYVLGKGGAGKLCVDVG